MAAKKPPSAPTPPARLARKATTAPAAQKASGKVVPKTKGWPTMPKPFTSWSYSRYGDWKKCPRFAHWKHILKKPEGPKNEAMERGIFIAKQEEDYFLGRARGIPPDINKALHPDFKFAKAQKTLMVEEQWGFNLEWAPVDYFDWNNCKLRVKVDFGWHDVKSNTIHLRDNKTGKFRERDNDSYVEQLELYVAGGRGRFPTAKMFTGQLLYTDLGIRFPDEPFVVTAAQADKLQKDWNKKVKPMFADTSFRPRPGSYCSWCPYSKSKGGDCEY